MTPAEAAQMKGCHVATVYRAVERGELPHTKVLRHIGLQLADVVAWEPAPYGKRTAGERGEGAVKRRGPGRPRKGLGRERP